MLVWRILMDPRTASRLIDPEEQADKDVKDNKKIIKMGKRKTRTQRHQARIRLLPQAERQIFLMIQQLKMLCSP